MTKSIDSVAAENAELKQSQFNNEQQLMIMLESQKDPKMMTQVSRHSKLEIPKNDQEAQTDDGLWQEFLNH